MNDCACYEGVIATADWGDTGLIQIQRCDVCDRAWSDIEAALKVSLPNPAWWEEDFDDEELKEGRKRQGGWYYTMEDIPGGLSIEVGVRAQHWEQYVADTRKHSTQIEQAPPIKQFRGRYRFLSNFFPAEITYNGFVCATNEHAFQLAKAATQQGRDMVAAADSPQEAKRVGRNVFLRNDWESVKLNVMWEITLLKYTTHPALLGMLLDTGDARLIEGNRWGDTFWGVSVFNGKGENHLGRILMRAREHLGKTLWEF